MAFKKRATKAGGEEVVIEGLIESLQAHQQGPSACEQTGRALMALKEALGHLQHRSKLRGLHKVEEKSEPKNQKER